MRSGNSALGARRSRGHLGPIAAQVLHPVVEKDEAATSMLHGRNAPIPDVTPNSRLALAARRREFAGAKSKALDRRGLTPLIASTLIPHGFAPMPVMAGGAIFAFG
jgi:hypothetical protein